MTATGALWRVERTPVFLERILQVAPHHGRRTLTRLVHEANIPAAAHAVLRRAIAQCPLFHVGEDGILELTDAGRRERERMVGNE